MENDLINVFENHVLMNALIAWILAQLIKVPLDYLATRKWNWALLLSVGGMPSSHSTLVTAVAIGTGLHVGFDSAAFAIAVSIAMVVVYDATGIRRQAGIHATRINFLVEELLSGHPISDTKLLEVLGHTPRETMAGVLWGMLCSVLFWKLWG
jgi:acid phosphatase family membrane protein YuiD